MFCILRVQTCIIFSLNYCSVPWHITLYCTALWQHPSVHKIQTRGKNDTAKYYQLSTNYIFQTDIHTKTCSSTILILNESKLQHLISQLWSHNKKGKKSLNITTTLMLRRHLPYILPVHRGRPIHFHCLAIYEIMIRGINMLLTMETKGGILIPQLTQWLDLCGIYIYF